MKKVSKNKAELLDKYERIFEKNPDSKVFAPLAEVYRGMGDLEMALKILKEGLKHHPTYSLGRLTLGRCYFDQGKFDEVYRVIHDLAAQEEDNLALQTLFARTLRQLNREAEALKTYKLVLFLNPRDPEAAEYIENYEDKLILSSSEPDINLTKAIFEVPIDDWVSVDFSRDKINVQKEDSETILNRFRKEIKSNHLEVESPNLDSSYLFQDFDSEAESVLPEKYEYNEGVESMQLVDLYCAQGAFEKAFSLLAKLIDHDPSDTKKLRLYEELKIVLEKNLDCSPLYKLKFKLKQFQKRIESLNYENSYY